MAKTWDQVKALLDDPSVPPEQKTALISSWQRENPPPPPWLNQDIPGTATPDQREEAGKYAEAYNATPFAGFMGTDAAYQAAQQAGDQASYNEREQQKAVDDGKTQLDGKQPPASGGAGTKTSDELFDAAAPALQVFQTFGSLLAKIPDDCRGQTRPLDFANDIQKRFDEQRGISFENFLADADHFKTGSTTVDQTIKDTGTALSTLFHSWSGSGANAASDNYNDQILPKANKLVQTLENANEATTTAVSTVFQLCKGKADAVANMYTNEVGKADYNMAQKVVAVANGEHGGKDDLKQIAGWMDLNFGTNLVDTLNDDGCCDDDDIKQHGQDLAKQWVQNQFNPDMWDRLYKGFDKTCKDTLDLVSQAYDALDDVMGKIKNEFEGAAPPSQQPPGPTQPSGSGGQGSHGGTGSGGDTGAGGGGSGSVPATPAATTPSATTDPTAQDPAAIADAAKKEAADGTNPLTGKPLEVNPETGEPSPIDPKTGEAVKDAGADQDTLTVQQGDHKLVMSEPDKDGKMDIKVGDGAGQPKDFKLDWGDGKDTVPTGGQDPAGFGPQGTQGGAPGADGTYRPGPDGKIHIEGGNLEITAERPDGPDGPTVVTVDDGSGTPTTYTLGEADSKDSAAGTENPVGADSATPQPGDTAAGKPDVTTMPAPADGSGADFGGGGSDQAAAAVSADQPAAAADVSPGSSDADAVTGVDPGQQTVPAAGGAGSLGPVGSGVLGSMEGTVSGSLGDPASLGTGAVAGSALPQPAQAALGAQPMGGVDPAQAANGGGLGSMSGLSGMMGGMGAAGGGGEDQERGPRAYRIDGGIFNSSGSGGSISGSLDDDGDRSVTQR
jgi:uncharacterized protein YukE